MKFMQIMFIGEVKDGYVYVKDKDREVQKAIPKNELENQKEIMFEF